MGDRVLTVEGLWKSFGGLRALESLDFTVSGRQIKSFIGPNGAGKTTLFNVLTGVFPPTQGTFEFAGRALNGMKHHAKIGRASCRERV